MSAITLGNAANWSVVADVVILPILFLMGRSVWAKLKRELNPNGGSSMRDAIDRIEKKQKRDAKTAQRAVHAAANAAEEAAAAVKAVAAAAAVSELTAAKVEINSKRLGDLTDLVHGVTNKLVNDINKVVVEIPPADG